MPRPYHLPSRCYDHRGQPRRAGFELEVGNLPVLQAAERLRQTLGGELDATSPFEAVLRGSSVGTLKIERDAQLLKSVLYRKWLQKLGVDFSPGTIAHGLETNLDSASAALVPCEVVTEPLPLWTLGRLDTLVTTLAAMGAQGTRDSPVYAFGLHINPSIPDDHPDTLRRFIQAFLLLSDWIIASSDIDLTRRFFTKYIDPYPADYVELLLQPDYRPDLAGLIDDYLRFNPTRNRALDMLPILSGLDRARVLEKLPEEERALVSARPAFHYRLPDCKLNMPGWTPAMAWNQWVRIEQLAADQALLGELIEEWRGVREQYSFATGARWILRLAQFLAERCLDP
jgi:hypothetical protein